MKKHVLKRIICMALMLLLLPVLAGCSGTGGTETKEEEPEEPLYPVSINGTEVLVGETKVQALLDAGFDVTWSEMVQGESPQIEEHVVEPDMELEANSYYTGASIWVSEHTFAHVSLATDEAVKLGDAVIARMEFYLSRGDEQSVLENIIFNGVPLTEMTREKAGEVFPDFTGDEAMWFSTGLSNYKYFMGFDNNTGELISFSVERKYDVDWNGSGN